MLIRKVLVLIISVLFTFVLVREAYSVYAAAGSCAYCSSCMLPGTCTLKAGWWCLHYGELAPNRVCKNSQDESDYMDIIKVYCEYDNSYKDAKGNYLHKSIGVACLNNCFHGPATLKCDDPCFEGDTCSNGTICKDLGGNEHRCRKSACSAETDCDCTPNTPTPTPSLTVSPSPTLIPCVDPANIDLSSSCNVITAKYTVDASQATSSDIITIQETATSIPVTLTPNNPIPENIGGRIINYNLTNATSGRDPMYQGNPTAIKEHPVTWTHTWFINGNPANVCSFTRTLNSDQYSIPSCVDELGQTGLGNPINLVPTITVIVNDTTSNGTGYVFDSDNPNLSGDSVLTCIKSAVIPAGAGLTAVGYYNCEGKTAGTTGAWTHNYYRTIPSCPAIKTFCAKPFTPGVLVSNPSGYMITRMGDVYTKGNVEQLKFQTTASFSTKTFSSSTTSHSLPTDCSVGSGVCSSSNYLLLGYSDKNTEINPTWQAILKSTLEQDETIASTIKKFNSAGPYTYDAALAQNFGVLIYDGDLTVSAGSKCQKKNIIIVDGNLNIEPSFTLLDNNAACLFIVRDRVNIGAGLVSPINMDTINAFIIASNITTTKDNKEALTLKGGLILTATTGQNIFARNVEGNLPSEIIEYEGARYINAFRDILKSPSTVSIKDSSYLR